MPPNDGLIRSEARRGSSQLALVCLICLIGAGGCATRHGTDVLPIAAETYPEAFETALDVAGDFGLPPAIRNRRSGLIETEPLVAASLAEPPRIDRPGGDRLENTISFRRRRARFEFSPADLEPGEAEEGLTGPDLLATESRPRDMTEEAGPLELRVRVYLEQAHSLGTRRSTWSRRLTTRMRMIEEDSEGADVVSGLFWTPVARDEDLERRLLAAIRHRLRD
jgi:hypothetical protein